MEQSAHQNKLLRIGLQVGAVTLIVALASLYIERNPEQLRTIFRASTEDKQISVGLYPQTIEVQTGNAFTLSPILVSKVKKPGFIQLTLRFDKTKVTFEQSEDSVLTKQLENLSPVDREATNVSGELVLMYGVSDPQNLPEESIQLSRLTFIKLTDDTTEITVAPEVSQIVFMDEQEAEILSTNTKIGLPGFATPSVVPTTVSSDVVPVSSSTPELITPTTTGVQSSPTLPPAEPTSMPVIETPAAM